jgi:phosphoribosyl-ATP pyrophosphohydrolase
VIAESADLLFHLTLLWSSMEIAPADVAEALKAREGQSGLDEKASREE